MQDLLAILTPADCAYLIGLIDSNVNLTDAGRLRRLLAEVEAHDTPATRAALNRQLEREIRYLGSSELLYWARYATGREPGAPFQHVVRDVAKALKVDPPRPGTAREQVEAVVSQYVTQQFAGLSPGEQQRLLEELGVEREKAAAFLKRSAGVFALPLLIQAFNTIVVEGLIKRIIFGTIARIIGARLARQLFQLIAGRFPWWVGWIGPAAWTISIGWTALDLQGPALRQTVPIVLYLGLCSLRERMASTPASAPGGSAPA
ncbi:hypothetical protein GQ464_014445 [Rhodocaloribacter litoris]|uniref:hypothetical protein n=1 Tax=Rhodocaloribacter litoris TaxID=2558931 RepID=UPI001420E9AE|nr:hypothetical protein [Rhodocaloribacter litoris]QXD14616.1 hypothetical protein GQ464_014445 [Rhodocaloribacter litoris]